MAKEELKKEAEEWVKDHSGLIGSYEYVKYDYDSLIQAYLASAEPREKRIAELERKLKVETELSNRLGLAYREYEQLTKEQDEHLAELEAQIEKMKCCDNCKFGQNRCYLKDGTGKACDEWEIKEE